VIEFLILYYKTTEKRLIEKRKTGKIR